MRIIPVKTCLRGSSIWIHSLIQTQLSEQVEPFGILFAGIANQSFRESAHLHHLFCNTLQDLTESAQPLRFRFVPVGKDKTAGAVRPVPALTDGALLAGPGSENLKNLLGFLYFSSSMSQTKAS